MHTCKYLKYHKTSLGISASVHKFCLVVQVKAKMKDYYTVPWLQAKRNKGIAKTELTAQEDRVFMHWMCVLGRCLQLSTRSVNCKYAD